jgi:hypothetical protein
MMDDAGDERAEFPVPELVNPVPPAAPDPPFGFAFDLPVDRERFRLRHMSAVFALLFFPVNFPAELRGRVDPEEYLFLPGYFPPTAAGVTVVVVVVALVAPAAGVTNTDAPEAADC